ncbi:something about silencing protein 10 isoform X1 [Carcharodon carcharias]|uniref:something about silencing protein 10 isoform X1 n=2 Tax=Carcharodon carcharias TaxID=13397 RepID=UPI001B7DEDE7|nr:something about silencing protein 10 isoform X1 [Carcharodon carcharias]
MGAGKRERRKAGSWGRGERLGNTGGSSRKKPKQQQQIEDDSDDPQTYSKLPNPNINSSEYFNDDVDEFHEKKLQKLLADGVMLDSANEDSEDEEEVMPLEIPDSEEEDEDEEDVDMDSDLEGKLEAGLPNDLAWGQKKAAYYNTDYVDELPRGKGQAEALAEAEEEEQEALNIQKRLAENLTEDDFGLDLIQAFAQEQEAEREPEKDLKIKKDLKKMSHKEQMKLLKKESPELLELIQDFKAKLAELRDELHPLMEMVQSGKIPAGKGANYVQTKYHLYLNYCTNISFYLILKAKRIPVHNHPVIERLLTYRNLINDLVGVGEKLSPEIQQLLNPVSQEHGSVAEKDQLASEVKKAQNQLSKQAKAEQRAEEKVTDQEVSGDSESDADEEAAFQYYKEMEERLTHKRKQAQLNSNEDSAVVKEVLGPDGKRKITYQIAKNKGLTPRRKKIDRNPRVKHREKFRRAKIRRKGQVREVRREEHRYGGELSGIRAGVKKSTKLQ